MKRASPPTRLALDWVLSGNPSEFHLTPAQSLRAGVMRNEGPAPLGSDVHAGLEIGLTLTGCAERHYLDWVVPGAPGDVWLCAMWEPHGWRFVAPRTDWVVAVFLPEFLGEERLGDLPWLTLFATPPSQRPRVSTPELRRTVLTIGEELRHEITRQQPGWQTPVRLDLLRLLFHLSRGWEPPAPSGLGPPLGAGGLSRITPALTLLREHDPPELSLSEAAAACGLKRSRFSAIFRQTMGLSFGGFRLRARLALAARLLRATALTTEDVAARIGFADASHLHRAFVKEYGCTPRQYRQRA